MKEGVRWRPLIGGLGVTLLAVGIVGGFGLKGVGYSIMIGASCVLLGTMIGVILDEVRKK